MRLRLPCIRPSFLLCTLLATLLCACASAPSSLPAADCGVEKPARPSVAPIQPAQWSDLPGWNEDDPTPAWQAFLASCTALGKQPGLQQLCRQAQGVAPTQDAAQLRAWLEAHLRPWRLTKPDGGDQGLITGYYEPELRGSRVRGGVYQQPLYAPPADLIDVDLSSVYPELANMRLRGRLAGNKLVPYWTRAEWAQQGQGKPVLLWTDDAVELFFLEIQGSGQVVLPDGSRVRVTYADQNGQPYRSVGRWLLDSGELKPGQATLPGIKAWSKSHPKRVREVLETNPSLVFFREVPLTGEGPPGALGVALTPRRSLAVDPAFVPLGALVWLSTTWPNQSKPLRQLMLAQDSGGAIRGPLRADFYWGSGADAGAYAGKMSQQGSMWLLMPLSYAPPPAGVAQGARSGKTLAR